MLADLLVVSIIRVVACAGRATVAAVVNVVISGLQLRAHLFRDAVV